MSKEGKDRKDEKNEKNRQRTGKGQAKERQRRGRPSLEFGPDQVQQTGGGQYHPLAMSKRFPGRGYVVESSKKRYQKSRAAKEKGHRRPGHKLTKNAAVHSSCSFFFSSPFSYITNSASSFGWVVSPASGTTRPLSF